METIKKLLSDILNIEFVQAVLSNPRKKEGILKVKVRPIEKKGNLFFQLESFTKTQAFHENLDPISARDRLLEYMEEFRQMQASTVHMNYTVLVSKKGKVTIQKKASKGSVRPVELSHNRSKKYILEEGIPVPFLQDLGVMTKDGKIVHSRFDKFRQINRFLEFIEDILPKLEKDREITILDYGLLKERFAALLTDGLRAKYLEQSGYETQVLEFIDMEHTPKNILLRAVKTNQAKQGSESQVWECRKFLGIDPMLGVLLDKGTES